MLGYRRNGNQCSVQRYEREIYFSYCGSRIWPFMNGTAFDLKPISNVYSTWRFLRQGNFVWCFRNDVGTQNQCRSVSCPSARQNRFRVPACETDVRKKKDKRGERGEKEKKDNSAPLNLVADL